MSSNWTKFDNKLSRPIDITHTKSAADGQFNRNVKVMSSNCCSEQKILSRGKSSRVEDGICREKWWHSQFIVSAYNVQTPSPILRLPLHPPELSVSSHVTRATSIRTQSFITPRKFPSSLHLIVLHTNIISDSQALNGCYVSSPAAKEPQTNAPQPTADNNDGSFLSGGKMSCCIPSRWRDYPSAMENGSSVVRCEEAGESRQIIRCTHCKVMETGFNEWTGEIHDSHCLVFITRANFGVVLIVQSGLLDKMPDLRLEISSSQTNVGGGGSRGVRVNQIHYFQAVKPVQGTQRQ